jgi:IS5 family transposase
VAEEKRRFLDDQRQRNAVEGKIGQGTRRFGLGLVREKLAATQGSPIALNVLVMNLEKLLELLFVLFTYWLQLLMGNGAAQSSQWMLLNDPSAAT